MNKVFVGGLSWNTNEEGLASHFSKFGNIEEARIITDRDTGRSRGFGFVTFSDSDSANRSVDELDGTEFDGRTIKVNIAEDKPRRENRGGHRGGNSRW